MPIFDLFRRRTKLPQAQEEAFRAWYGNMANRWGLDTDPDNPLHKYDYRGAFLAGYMPDESGHLPSKFKDPDHPNRFVGGTDTMNGGLDLPQEFSFLTRPPVTADALKTALAPQPAPETPTIGATEPLEPTFDDFVRSVHSNIDERISGLSQFGTLGGVAAQALNPVQGQAAREELFNIVSGMGKGLLADATQRLVRIAREGPLQVMAEDIRKDPARPLFELAEMMPFAPKGGKLRVPKGRTPKSHIFGKIEVVENPSQRMMEQMADEVAKQGKSQFLRESTGEARRAALENTTLRGLKDAEGNVFVWKGTEAIHSDIEKQLLSKGLLKQGSPSPVVGLRPAGDVVDNRKVRSHIPNMSSIDASVKSPEVLDGLYEVPMSEFNLTGRHYSVAGNERIKELAEQIKKSGEISPLIVVKDHEGFYILEGVTRAEALYRLGAKSFPAKVVIEDAYH